MASSSSVLADQWPSDYGRRAEEDKKTCNNAPKAVTNVDEQGERANALQPPKGLRTKR
jgi:hypothetical protein